MTGAFQSGRKGAKAPDRARIGPIQKITHQRHASKKPPDHP